jgi:serine/threonine-protein kinase
MDETVPAGLFAPYDVVRPIGARPRRVYAVRRAGSAPSGRAQLAVGERFEGAAIAGDPRAEAFALEARRIATLASPSLARAREVIARGDDLVIFSEFVDGEKLSALWPPESLPLEIALRAILDVLGAVGTLHNARDARQQPMKLAHGEISTATVVFGTDGIARVLHAVSRRFPGTEFEPASTGYLAPEVALGEPFDARADVYGAGVLLWEVLSGQRLFAEGDPATIAKQVRAGGVPAATVPGKADWAKGLVDVAAKALAASPEARWPTAAAMAAEVRKSAGLKLAPASAAAAFARKAIGERVKARREALEGAATGRAPLPVRESADPGAASSAGPTEGRVRTQTPTLSAGPTEGRVRAQTPTLSAGPTEGRVRTQTPTSSPLPEAPAATSPRAPAEMPAPALVPPQFAPEPAKETSTAANEATEVIELESESVLDALPTLPPPPVAESPALAAAPAPAVAPAPAAAPEEDVHLLDGPPASPTELPQIDRPMDAPVLPPPTVPLEPPVLPALYADAAPAQGPGPLAALGPPDQRRRKVFVLGGVAALGLLVFGLAVARCAGHRETTTAATGLPATGSAASPPPSHLGAGPKPIGPTPHTTPVATSASVPTLAGARQGVGPKPAAAPVTAAPLVVPATAHPVLASTPVAATAHGGGLTPQARTTSPAPTPKPRPKPTFVPNSL